MFKRKLLKKVQITGLGDQMHPYLGLIRENIKCGKQLEALDDDSLKKMGISALGARKTILQAVTLLLYFVSFF